MSIVRFNPDPGPEQVPSAAQPAADAADLPPSFESFVELHYQAAYRFALSLSGNHNDACDITQQAFYLAFTRSHQLRDPAKRKQWLFTILHREFLRGRRRENAHPEVNLEFSEPVLPHIDVDHASGLDSKALLVVLQSLDPDFRIPLVLFYLEQLSYKEIAATLEVPIGTVMSRLARGKQMLRQRFEKGGRRGQVVPILGSEAEGPANG